ncbi:MFS transporter [Hanamia caeni]|jgi:SHS family lactate transporter-like MFS transporter|nr:MFS transporter [Hanamia caeni]
MQENANFITNKETRRNQTNAMLAGFLGWTLDAFDFFILTFVLATVATDFNVTVPEMALTLTASLVMRPVGALVFGLLSDRIGRKLPLMISIIFYSVMEILSGLAPNYQVFLALRFLYGVGMGGEWGVGASLVMETVSVKRRGLLSGLLQEGYAFGFLLAAAAYYFVFPKFGWRAMFFVGGLPALLTLFIRSKVKETEAWKANRSLSWKEYGNAIKKNWKLFLYLVLLMSMMNLISHGTQDLYPTFLQKQKNFDPHETAVITMISMVGAILGGLFFGYLSDFYGRKKMMAIAVVLALLLIPLWLLAGGSVLIALGAFGMQFMVQGAWGIIPAHINELSPGPVRGFFPGFAYQLGVLIAAAVPYVEATLAENLGYATAMEIAAGSVLAVGAIIILAGPEARGIHFHKVPAS